MVVDVKQYELNRIVDMIKTRNYQVTTSSIKDEMIFIEAEKSLTGEAATTRDLEASWISNFLKTLGWTVQSTSFPGDKIVIQFVKKVAVQTP